MSRTTAILLTAALGLGATAANAHPRLQSSDPAPGASLKSAPKDIRMSFSEGLVPNFTGLELKTAAGKSVPTGKTALVAGDNKKIVVPITARLVPGTYNVAWHAVSVDTHRVTGSYNFKVMR
ncbi:MAG TPA: copper homeostasis periplasmic binding protein CopC [Bryobacteraceae bacterium]